MIWCLHMIRKGMRRLPGLPAVLGTALALLALALLSPVPAEAGQRLARAVTVDGLKRTFTVVLPDNPGSRQAWPVIFAFHPAAAKGNWMERTTRLHAVPGGGNYVVVYPDGYYPTWNAGDCCGRAHRNRINDLAFYNAMRQDIARLVPVEPRAYLTGFSNGSRMVYHIMCTQPETVAAAVAVGATRNMENCRAGRIPLIHIHGLEDKGSPVEGGYTPGQLFREDIGYMEPAAKVVRTVARRNGCGTGQTQNVPKPTLGTTCSAYASCPGGAVSMLCLIPKMGHAWPGGPQGLRMFGPYRPDLRGSAEVIDFFNRHR